LANVHATRTEKPHARTAEHTVFKSTMDAYIPFKIQGLFVFNVYSSKQQENPYNFAFICLYRNQKRV